MKSKTSRSFPPLLVHLDTNVYSHLFQNDFPELTKIATELVNGGRILIIFNCANFYEILCQINQNNFLDVREKYRRCSKLCNGNTFEDDWGHVQSSIYYCMGDTHSPRLEYRDVLKAMTSAPDYNKVKDAVEFLQTHAGDFLDNWTSYTDDRLQRYKDQLLQELNQQYKSSKDRLEAIKREFEGDKLDLLRQSVWKSFVSHYRLPSRLAKSSYEEFFHIPAVRYCINVHIAYYEKMLLQKMKARRDHYFDIEQVVYLDIMDYFITNDGQLFDLLQNRHVTEIKDRVLKFDNIGMLHNLEPRAPKKAAIVKLT